MLPTTARSSTAEKRSASPIRDNGSPSELRSQLEQAAAGAAGTKRRRTAEPKYYGVKSGFKPGVYYKWDECLAQVKGFKGAVCKFVARLTGVWEEDIKKSRFTDI